MTDLSLSTRFVRMARGLWTHVQPVFLLPGAAVSAFGALLADEVTTLIAIGHVVAVSLAVYVAHLKDGYIDYYVREEDDANPLSATECRTAIAIAIVAFAAVTGGLWMAAGPVAFALTAPIVTIGYAHAPHLDANPVTATVDYPLGIVLAMTGGYATQTGTISPSVAAICLVLFPLLVASNVLLDMLDHHHDRRVSK